MTRWATCLVLFFLFSGCKSGDTESEYPMDFLGFRDATTTRALVVKAINRANEILQYKGKYILTPSWIATGFVSDSMPGERITVYLLRPKGQFSTHEKEKTVLDSFSAVIKGTQPNPQAIDCPDTSECVHEMYKGSNIGKVVANILSLHATLQLAKIKVDRKYVALIDGDVQRFQLLFGKGLEGEQAVPFFEYFLAIILLHEVGHLDQTFQLDSLSLPAEAKLIYNDYLSFLNYAKKEEARADAYASNAIAEVGGLDTATIALYIPFQGVLAYGYYLFDKSQGGICRHYFDPTEEHPNFEMRYRAMYLILQPNSRIVQNLMSNYLLNRRAIMNKDYSSENKECARLSR